MFVFLNLALCSMTRGVHFLALLCKDIFVSHNKAKSGAIHLRLPLNGKSFTFRLQEISSVITQAVPLD